MASTTDGSEGAGSEQPVGLFGRLLGRGGKKVAKAKMGGKLEMYYNKELGAWVMPGEEEEKKKELEALKAPPPPKAMSSASMPAAGSTNEDDTGSAVSKIAPVYGGPRGARSGVTSRYASAPTLSISSAGGNAASDGGATASSVFSGLKPPSSFGLPGKHAGMAPAVFKPLAPIAQEQEATSPRPQEDAGSATAASAATHGQQDQFEDIAAPMEAVESIVPDDYAGYGANGTGMYDNTNYENQEGFGGGEGGEYSATAAAAATVSQDLGLAAYPEATPAASMDPVILEVLSFYSYYRKCGYDSETLGVWVKENYDYVQCIGLDYEGLLEDPSVRAAVVKYISENKRSAPGSPSSPLRNAPSPPRSPPSPSEDMDTAAAVAHLPGGDSVVAPQLPLSELTNEMAEMYAAPRQQGGESAQEWSGFDDFEVPPADAGEAGETEINTATTAVADVAAEMVATDTSEYQDGNTEYASMDQREISLQWGYGSAGGLEVNDSDRMEHVAAADGGAGQMQHRQQQEYHYEEQYSRYDQYGQYHTTAQYHVEAEGYISSSVPSPNEEMNAAALGGAGEVQGVENNYQQQQKHLPAAALQPAVDEIEDPTLGQVLGSFLRPVMQRGSGGGGSSASAPATATAAMGEDEEGAGLGQIMSSVGGTIKGLLSDVATGKLGTALTGEDVGQGTAGNGWGAGHGFETPREVHEETTIEKMNAVKDSNTDETMQYNDDQMIPVQMYSPGQLAADIGVPRESVTMTALFAAEAASLGTLSSKNSEDGWSDTEEPLISGGGGAAGGQEQESAAVAAAYQGVDKEVVMMEPAATADIIAAEGGGWGSGSVGDSSAEIKYPEVIPEERAVLPTAAEEYVMEPSPTSDYIAAEGGVSETAAGWGDDDGWGNDDFVVEEAAAMVAEAGSATVGCFAEANQSLSLPPPPPPSGAVASVGSAELQQPQQAQISAPPSEEMLAELESLRAALQAARGVAESATLERNQVREEAAVHAASLAEAMGARDALAREKEELESEIEALRSDAAELPLVMSKCAELEHSLEERKEATAEADARATTLQAERDALLQELAAQKEALVKEAAAAAEATAAAGSAAVLQAELDEAKEELEARESELNDLRDVVELKDDAIAALQVEEKQAQQEKAEAVAALEARSAELAALKEELSASQTAQAEASAYLEEIQGRMERAVAEAVAVAVAEKSEEMNQLEAALKEEIASQESQIAALEGEISTIVDAKDGEIMQLEARAMTAEHAAGEAQAAAATAEAQAAALASKDAELESAQARIKELEKKFVLAKKKIAQEKALNENLTNEVAALKSQLEQSTAGRDGDLAEMAAALDAAAFAQQSLTAEAAALQTRLEELSAAKAAEVEALAADNAQLAHMLGERDAHVESLAAEVETWRQQASQRNAADEAVVAELRGQLEAAYEDISQWNAVAEDADARCTAAEESLAAEQAAREESAAAAAHWQQELAALQQVLASTEAQLSEVVAMQEAAGAQELEDLRQHVAALESELAAAHAAMKELDRGGYEDALEEVTELKTQLAAASQVAAGKEEEMRKYKLQLVKAKKLRASDAEKIAALEHAVAEAQAAAATTGGAAGAPGVSAQEVEALRGEISSLREQLDAMRAASAEADDGLNVALSALGSEEAKVARLAELLMERGMDESAVEEELAAVEELMLLEDEEGSGQGGEGGAAASLPEEREESLV